MASSVQPAGAIRVVGTTAVGDQMFSPDSKYLYVTTGGTVTAYSAATGDLLQSWTLGKQLGGIDLSSDGRYLVATEITASSTTSSTYGSTSTYNVYVLDTVSGTQRTFVNQAGSGDGNFYDASFLVDGKILLSQHYNGSGFEPLTTLDPNTGAFTRGTTSYYMNGTLNATPDHREIVFTPQGISDAPVFVYTSGTGITASQSGSGYNSGVEAISPDGSLIAQGVGLNIYNANLKLQVSLQTLYPEITSITGMAFGGDGKTLYLLNSQANAVYALSTGDWSLVGLYPLDAALAPSYSYNGNYGNELTASGDGHYLSVIAATGAEIIDLTKAVSAPGTLGNDSFTATSGYVYGLAGNDRISITGDVAGVRAGSGDDVIAITAPGTAYQYGASFIDGGAGDDTLDLSAVSSAALAPGVNGLSLAVGTAKFAVSGIEHVVFGANADIVQLSGTDRSTLEVRGGAGDDSLQGGPNMILRGEAGNDTLWLTSSGTTASHGIVDGGAGIDQLRVGAGFSVDLSAGTAHAGAADYGVIGIENVLITVAGIAATVTGDDGANILTVNPFRDDGSAGVVFDGRGGDDQLTGSAGADQLSGGTGDDRITGGAGNDLIDGGTGHDTAVLAETLAQVTAKWTDPTTVVISGPDGTDTIRNVETLQFSDGSVSLDGRDPLVDPIFYDQHNPDVYRAGLNPTAHYLQYGAAEGRDPNAFFSTAGYLATNPDVAASGMNPLLHFEQFGWRDGRDPSAAFDTKLYLLHNPDIAQSGLDPLEQYLNYGIAEGRAAYPVIGDHIEADGFDAHYYLLQNPDVAAAGVDPYQHYLTYGWKEGRNPNAWFDDKGYLAHNQDVAQAGINPLDHYDQFGWKEGRDPSAAFDTKAYLAANPDVAQAGIDPLVHFLQHGAFELRSPHSDGVMA